VKAECIDAVTQAIGRSLNANELKNIEDRVRSAMPAARVELQKAGQAVTPRSMMEMAAEIASKGLEADAAKVKQRIANTIAAHDRVQNYLATAKARGIDSLTAIDQLVAFDAKATGRVMSIETQGKAIGDEAVGQLVNTFEATNPTWFGMVEDMAGVRLLVKEMMGENTGSPEAAAGAKAWKETTEALRLRFNQAGGDIGKLEDWGLPHHHSQSKVWKAGADAWVKDIMPMLNRDKYVRPDGTLMDDAELDGVLRKAWETISSNGMNKIEPGKVTGSAMRANWGSESRQIHFKDGDGWTAYQTKYGEQGFYDVMMGHVRGIAHQIALVETFGPNPNRSFELFRDQAILDGIAAKTDNPNAINEKAMKTTRLFNHVAGQVLPVANEGMARGFDSLRSWLVASRLGSAVITSITDEATMALMGHVNNLPEMQILRNELTALNPANKTDRRLLARMGLAGEVMASNLGRFGQEGLGASFASKMATATIRASGLSAMTAARKAAFGATMMDSIGQLVKTKGFDKLDPLDHRILLSKGVTETDWAVWRLANLETWRGNETMLTPEAVRAIPDAEIAKVMQPEIDKIKAAAKAQIDELNARNDQETGWVDKRIDRFKDAQAAAAKKIGKMAVDKDAKVQKLSEALQARIDLVQAEIERVKVRAEIEAAFQNEKNSDNVRGLLADVHRATNEANEYVPGANSELSRIFEGKADSLAARVASAGGSLGRQYGLREGALTRRIVEIEARIRNAERSSDAEVMRADKAETKRLDDIRDELAAFWFRSNERQQRRQFVMDRIARDVDPQIGQAIGRARSAATTRLLGAVLEEVDMAVITPGARTKVITQGSQSRGTLGGELWRSIWLFKSFPLAMIERHVSRGMNWGGESGGTAGGRAKYLMPLVLGTTLLGGLAVEISEILAGRDPKNANPWDDPKKAAKFWAQAFFKGGSLGLYGDFIYSEATQHGGGGLSAMLGPVAGLAEEMIGLTQGNLIQMAQGKDTRAGAELVKAAKGLTPGASLWYVKGAADHLFFQQLQNELSPGYLSSMASRARREFGQEYFWEPGHAAPSRAPDISRVAGG
jgi:hypothetical protein